MAKHTDRDEIWNYAMMFALEGLNNENKHIKVKYIRNRFGRNPPSDRTIRDVLNTMTYQGWLQKEKKQSHKWYPGDALRDLEFKEFSGATIGSVHNMVGKPDDAGESDPSTTETPEPDTSNIDEDNTDSTTEKNGMSNGDVPAQPHGSDEDNAGSTESQLPEIPDSPFDKLAAGPDVLAQNLDNVGKDRARSLVAGGYSAINDLHQASPDDLADVRGIGDVLAENICWQVAGYVRGEYDISDEQFSDATVSEVEDMFNVSTDMAKKWQSNGKA